MRAEQPLWRSAIFFWCLTLVGGVLWPSAAEAAMAQKRGFALTEEVIYLLQPSEDQKLAILDWNGKWLKSAGTEEPQQPDTLLAPVELLTDAAGNCYVLDQFGPSIIVFNSQGQALRRWGTRGFERGEMRQPVDFGLDDLGQLYVLDLGREAVLRFSTWGDFIDEIALDAATTAKLHWSTAIAVASDGTFYLVADQPGVEGLLRTLTRYSAGGDRTGQLTVAKADAMGTITDLAVLPEGKLLFVDHQSGTGSSYSGALYLFSSLASLEWRHFLSDPQRGRRYSPVRVKVFNGATYALTSTNLVVRVGEAGVVERSWGAGEL